MSLLRSYAPAGSKCSGGATPGAKAFMAWSLGAYMDRGVRNDGIYNCRAVRGGTSPSLHGEGRALDIGCKAEAAWAQTLANLLVAHSAELGVQCVIYRRRIWSGAHAAAGWRPYDGVDGHTTHLHVELSKKAARSLTVAHIASVLAPARPVYRRVLAYVPGKPLLKGQDVKQAQKAAGMKDADVDGKYGSDTQKAVRALQRRQGVAATGKWTEASAKRAGWRIP